MLDLIRDTPIYPAYGQGVTIDRLKDNAASEPRIRIHDYNYQFHNTNWRSEPTTVWMYICYQALSKLLAQPLVVLDNDVRGKDEQLERSLDWSMGRRYEQHFNLMLTSIAPSNFKRPSIKRFRERYEQINSREDILVQKYTDNAIFGLTKAENTLMVFYNQTVQIDVLKQLRLATLIYRNIPRLVLIDVEKEENFFRLLSEYFVKVDKGLIEDDAYLNALKVIFIDYCNGQKEYTLNSMDQIVRIIRKTREEKLQRYLNNVNTARGVMQDYLERLMNAQNNYNEANEIYTAMLNTTTEDLERNLIDAIDLLKRSSRVIEHGFDNMQLWFTIHQPLYINDKDAWERISNNLLRGINKECVNKALVNEEFELWTECTVALDLQRNTITRYGRSSRTISGNAIPHPHISGYNCFGQHTAIIARLLTEGDITGAIEQTIEAASGMNYADGPVVNKFADYVVAMMDKPFFKKDDEWFNIIDYTERIQNAIIETETNADN